MHRDHFSKFNYNASDQNLRALLIYIFINCKQGLPTHASLNRFKLRTKLLIHKQQLPYRFNRRPTRSLSRLVAIVRSEGTRWATRGRTGEYLAGALEVSGVGLDELVGVDVLDRARRRGRHPVPPLLSPPPLS